MDGSRAREADLRATLGFEPTLTVLNGRGVDAEAAARIGDGLPIRQLARTTREGR